MKTTSQHISFIMLADLAENRASETDKTTAASHLSVCVDCAGKLRQLGQALELMRTDNSMDAPRDVLAYSINIFKDREQVIEPSRLRRIVAALSFDSFKNMAPAYGVRSGQDSSRQLLYSAEESDIDLRIRFEEENWFVTGQVLGQDCVGGRVEIEGENGSADSALNELCEFTLPPLAPGSYTLHLQLGNTQVVIPQLELRS
jgi:hypothetical protein